MKLTDAVLSLIPLGMMFVAGLLGGVWLAERQSHAALAVAADAASSLTGCAAALSACADLAEDEHKRLVACWR